MNKNSSDPEPQQRNAHVHARARHHAKLALENDVNAEQAKWEANESARGRLKQVTDWLDDRFRDGAIKTLTRYTNIAAAPHEMPPTEWFCDDTFGERMRPGQYKRWYYQPQVQQYDVYIFVDRSSLEAALNMKAEPVVNGIELDSLSPYLRLAIAVAIEQQISEENKQTVPAIGAELRRRASDFGLTVGSGQGFDLSETFAEDIAKAIRWPNARAGKGMVTNHKP